MPQAVTRTPEECIRLVQLSTYNATRLLPQEITPEVAQACVSAAKSGIKWLPIQARTADLWRQAIQMRPQNVEHLDYKDYFEGLDDLCLNVLQADAWLALELQTDLLKRLPRTCGWIAGNMEGTTNLIGRAIWRHSRQGGLNWAKTVRSHAQKHLQQQERSAAPSSVVDVVEGPDGAQIAKRLRSTNRLLSKLEARRHKPLAQPAFTQAQGEPAQTSQPRRQRGG